jgi:hypothetical protein
MILAIIHEISMEVPFLNKDMPSLILGPKKAVKNRSFCIDTPTCLIGSPRYSLKNYIVLPLLIMQVLL